MVSGNGETPLSAPFESMAAGVPLYLSIAQHLEQMVVSGELQSGEKLPAERKLSETFGVSRAVVREAIKFLEQRGLVKVLSARGIFVVGPQPSSMVDNMALFLTRSSATFDDVLEAREMIEVTAAGFAAERATEDDLLAIEQAMVALERSGGKIDSHVAADLNFHVSIAKAAQNPAFYLLMYALIDLMKRSRWAVLVTAPRAIERSFTFHKAIHDAIARHDRPAAEKAMREHLAQVRGDIEYLRANGVDLPGRFL